jgi:cellobiose phosphorylase
MQYGYFYDRAKEYVITRPDTPGSWSNYLGSTEYGAIITNNAGGYGFYQSGARGRFLRLRFNSVPLDQPGRYFYLRDQESGDYWSAAWQPVGKALEEYESVCRHGTAYTTIAARYGGIATESTYFVPLGERFEYWRLKVTNESERVRRIDPCIPRAWDGFKARRRFRGVEVRIEVRNPEGVCRGVREMRLNGEVMEGNLVPVGLLEEENYVEVVLGN